MSQRRRRPLTDDERDRRRLVRRRQQVRRRRAGAALALLLAIGLLTAWAAFSDPTGGSGVRTVTTHVGSGTTTAAAGGPSASASTSRPPPDGPPITIGWSGDAVPASDALGLPADPSILFGQVASILHGPDVMVGNLEGTLTRRGTSKCGGGSPNCYAFRSPPGYARLYADAGYDVMNLANNHADDYGDEGLADTAAALDRVGLAHTGAPGQITLRTLHGVRVAFVGFASYRWSAPLNNPAGVRALVRRAAAQADLVIVLFHGGAEGTSRQHVPSGREDFLGENRGDLRAFARTAIDAGADAVLGSGPHVLRGMEVYHGRLVAYSVGNFVGYGTFALGGALSQSAVVELTLRPNGSFVRGRIVPTQLVGKGSAAPDPSGGALSTIRSLSASDFGARAPQIGSDGSIKLPQRA